MCSSSYSITFQHLYVGGRVGNRLNYTQQIRAKQLIVSEKPVVFLWLALGKDFRMSRKDKVEYPGEHYVLIE